MEKKEIKFWNWSMCGFADIADKLEELTNRKPKHFRCLYDGTSDYVVAYSNGSFSYKQALKAYSRIEENMVTYEELLELNKLNK